ncbi:hypothetical protein MSAN_01367400 [Mycena sanguinolenta]|uniref:DUF5648 domain-containing protein n=1 Tax=Mycena sanguinolenta TaxID=230812 RepID=A0A8H6Y9Y2_9AGAR|nr:hypothetical protein MSAN_01367400 [Mycena sanguinolenta]
MKTSAISMLFTSFAAVARGLAVFQESTTLNSRTEATPQTCGDVSDLTPFAELYIPSITAHVYTTNNDVVTDFIVGNPGTTYLGVTALIFSIADTSTVPFYCLRSSSAYFYTTNQTERAAALASGFVEYLSPVGYIYPSQICGSVPLYRLHFIAANPDYIYTTSTTERDNAAAMGFTYEGVAGYVYDLLSCGSPES